MGGIVDAASDTATTHVMGDASDMGTISSIGDTSDLGQVHVMGGPSDLDTISSIDDPSDLGIRVTGVPGVNLGDHNLGKYEDNFLTGVDPVDLLQHMPLSTDTAAVVYSDNDNDMVSVDVTTVSEPLMTFDKQTLISLGVVIDRVIEQLRH
jgi:hypothetical protein